MDISGKFNPYFSIIITCYNYERYIESSILSVLNQTYSNFEIIVVDDGSTDSSWKIISRYSSKVKSVSTENRGFISACAKGFSLSSGDFIIFLDADDELMPNALGKIAQKFQDSDVTKVQYMMQPVDQFGIKLGSAFPKLISSENSKGFVEDIKVYGCYATPPTSGNAYRRDVYQDLGDISYDYGIDGVAYLLAPFKGKVYHLSEVLAKYRIHNNNMSSSGFSESKMLRNSTVFLRRLQHLDEILRCQNIEAHNFAVLSEYPYTIECKLHAAILAGSNSRFLLFREYYNISKAHPKKEDSFLLIYFFIAIISPRTLASKLLIWRLNQNKASKIRMVIKKLFAPY